MPAFLGSGTSATSNSYSNPMQVVSYFIANKTGGSITASVGVLYGSTIVYWYYNKSLAAGENIVYSNGKIIIPENHQVFVTASGTVDYHVSITPLVI